MSKGVKVVDKLELMRRVKTNGFVHMKTLYRSPTTGYMPLISSATPESVLVDINLEFALIAYTLDKLAGVSIDGYVGATEKWMIADARLAVFQSGKNVTPLLLDEEALAQQVRKELGYLLDGGHLTVAVKDCYLRVRAGAVVRYQANRTLGEVREDIERFVIAAINKYLQKPMKMSRKRRRTLQEKLGDWLWADEPFQHYGGRLFTFQEEDGARTIEIKINPNSSITILRERYSSGIHRLSVRRNTTWPFGLERFKTNFLNSLPEGVEYIEMKVEEM